MNIAALTKTVKVTGTVKRVEALSMSCLSFLSLGRPKLQQDLTQVKHAKALHTHHFAPRPANACVMLTESDVSRRSHGIVP